METSLVENSVMREYIHDPDAAVFVADIEAEIPAVIQTMEADPARREALGRAAGEQYQRHFSRAALSTRLTEILDRDPRPHDGEATAPQTVASVTAARAREIAAYRPGRARAAMRR